MCVCARARLEDALLDVAAEQEGVALVEDAPLQYAQHLVQGQESCDGTM